MSHCLTLELIQIKILAAWRLEKNTSYRPRYLNEVLQQIVDGDPAVRPLLLTAQYSRPLVAEGVGLDFVAHFPQNLNRLLRAGDTGREKEDSSQLDITNWHFSDVNSICSFLSAFLSFNL